jgi:hypothetical protein
MSSSNEKCFLESLFSAVPTMLKHSSLLSCYAWWLRILDIYLFMVIIFQHALFQNINNDGYICTRIKKEIDWNWNISYYSEKFVWHTRCLFTSLIDKTDPVDKTPLFLKPTDFDKNRLATLHSWQRKHFLRLRNAQGCGWPWFILTLPTDSCC